MTLWKVTASGVRLADELSRPRTPCGVHPRDRDTGGTADSRERLDPRVHACHDNGAQSGYGLMNQPCQRFTGEPQSDPTPRLAAAVRPDATGQPETSPGRCSRFRRGSTFAAARQHNDGAGRRDIQAGQPVAFAIGGARLAGWLGRLITGNGTAVTGSGLGGDGSLPGTSLPGLSVRWPARLTRPAAVWPGRANA